MYVLGDIGNSKTKIFLVNSKDKIIKATQSKFLDDKRKQKL